MTWILAILRRIPLQAWLGLAGLVLVALVLWAVHHDGYKAGQAEGQAKLTAHLQADAKALAQARADAETDRAKRQKDADSLYATLQKDKADALAKQNRLIADLRAGTVQLQKRWLGCSTGHGTGNGPGVGDGEADLRNESAGRIIGYADSADAQVIYLQGLIQSAPQCFKIGE